MAISEERIEELLECERVLVDAGYVRCDIPICNCGSWHPRGGFYLRFTEIENELTDAGIDMNGVTLLRAVKNVLAEWKELTKPIPHTFGNAIYRVAITEEDEVIRSLAREDCSHYIVPIDVMEREFVQRLEEQAWTCGCGHVNGPNLATCAQCSRPPGGGDGS